MNKTLLSLTKKAAALLLIVQCLMPAGALHAKTSANTKADKPGVSINTATLKNMVFSRQLAAIPSSLQSFTKDVVNELSLQESFGQWKNASISYQPLGPGTHSWLATVSQNGKPIGYLILTSTDDGNYMLSEYGRDESMPYNTQALYSRLKQLGILQAGSKLPAGVSIEARYSALLPVWEISQPGKKAIYLHGITAEELPLQTASDAKAAGGLTPHPGIRVAGTMIPVPQRITDPYDNLMWLASPKLSLKQNGDLMQAVTKGRNSLVFTSPGRNADYGAPFAITGIHAWSADGSESEILYAASGKNGSRFLPASELIGHGEFHSLNLSQI
ncbi:hypothetical protein [Paenibacillus azoreducens]|uniref:Uncharacterized protein n=1 Tax=Paenibacillus azoreducens TaxID=116718 RepID=A0A919YGF6_9BACL|nr:hypothetical protein [Paenibacillus azoreducens]GIO49178.1 hypothetical protein J34TS1_39430 [Paenibacillus azoreducens]